MRINTIAILLIAATAMPALATVPTDAVPTRHVKYSDLNLATPKGVAAFERRVRLATVEVCRPAAEEPGSMLLDEPAFRACREASLARVHPQMLAAIEHASDAAWVPQPIVALASR